MHRPTDGKPRTGSAGERSLFGRVWDWLLEGDSGAATTTQAIIIGAVVAASAGFVELGKELKTDLDLNARRVGGAEAALLPELSTPDLLCEEGSCRCFAAGTLVATETGDRPIETLHVGDNVWALDVDTGELALQPIVHRFVTPGQPVLHVELESELWGHEQIAVTSGHPFWVADEGWVPASELALDALGGLDSVVFGSAEQQAGAVTVYNLEVAEFHTYFVGQTHALVHNARAKKRPADEPALPAKKARRSNGNDDTGGCQGSAPGDDDDGDDDDDDDDGGDGDGTASAPPEPDKPELDCGQNDTYAKLLEFSAGDQTGPKNERYERDHIPQYASLELAASRQLEKEIEREIDEVVDQQCRPLTPEEEKSLRERVVREVAGGIGLFNAKPGKRSGSVFRGALAIAIPKALHEEGRTYGSPPDPSESADLYETAQADIDYYLELLTVQPGERVPRAVAEGWVTADCAATLRAELPKFLVNSSHEDYETEIGNMIEKARKNERTNAKIGSLIASTVQDECQDKPPVGEEAMDD